MQVKHIKAGAGHHKGGKHTRAGGADLKWEERWVKPNKTGRKTIKKWNKDNRSHAYKPTNIETASWTVVSHHHPPIFIPTWKSVHRHVICTHVVEMLIWHTWAVHIKCLNGLRKHTMPTFYPGDWPRAMSPCRLTYWPLQLNLEAELIIYLGERQYARRLMSDNSALWWKRQDEQKKYSDYNTTTGCLGAPFGYPAFGSDAELLVMVLSNQPSLMLVLLGITLERTDCLLLSAWFQTGD